MPTTSCCTFRRGCRTPTPTTSLGICRKDCTGIIVIFTGSLPRKSMRVSRVCLRSDERMATCRSSPKSASRSATWPCNTISSLIVPAVSRSSTIRTGRSGSARSWHRRMASWRTARTVPCWRRSTSAAPSQEQNISRCGTRGRFQSKIIGGNWSSFPAISSNSPRPTATPGTICRPIPRFRIISAICSSPSTASFSRSSRARRARPKFGCSRM